MPLYDLKSADSFSTLVEDVVELVARNPVPWDADIQADAVEARCTERSLMAVFSAIMDINAEENGKETWICKSLQNVNFLDQISAHPSQQRKFIYLYRDGRDVCLSFMKAPVGHKTVYHIAKQWHAEQQKALKFREAHPDQVISISYEELTSAPQQSLQRICAFMEIEYSEKMLEFHSSTEAAATAQGGAMWGNVTKPIQQSNTKKWLKQMDPFDLRVFEEVAGDSLVQLGFDLHTASTEESVISEEFVSKMQIQNAELKAQFGEDLS
mmetsp:Transcript_24296/g.33137  ORF Transcript_24296/g.33137 Transcript_24296/m.33137 type:complete len:268 (+) Transcript_24296:213-1016(+)